MGLHQSKDAKHFFRHLTKGNKYGKLNDRGEQYYICLMVGLLNRKISPEVESKQKEEIMVRGWSEGLRTHKYQILASVVATEVRRTSIPTDSDRYRKLMLKYLSGDEGLFNLTPLGVDLFDRYSEGGFRIIQESISDPKELDIFLIELYSNLLESDE